MQMKKKNIALAGCVLVGGLAPRVAGYLAHLDGIDAYSPTGLGVAVRHDGAARLAVFGDCAGPHGAADPLAVHPDVDGFGSDSTHARELSRPIDESRLSLADRPVARG